MFAILFELDKYVDVYQFVIYNARVYGLVSECLLYVWLEYCIAYNRQCVSFMEPQCLKKEWIVFEM